MSGPVVHLEIAAKDPEAARSYYSGLFGWELNADNPMNYGTGMITDDVGVGIGPLPPGRDSGHAIFYVGVDDVEAALAKAESLGGKRLMGPMAVPDGPTIGHFADPEGQVIGLFQGM
jgi:predicted enzyme related to lactoylglutathione lyase